MEFSWCNVVGAVLLFISIRIVFPLCVILYRYCVSARSLTHVKRLRKTEDDWAVITGGTDGIGKAYAEELASLGFNIFIISRSLEKLQQVTTSIESEYKVRTKYIQADFTKPDIYSNIREEFKGVKVVVLVNNVGMTQTYPCPLWEFPVPDSFYIGMAHCNMTSALMCTRAALREGGMLERNCGLIINISSASALYPLALAAMYSSTKAFVDFLSCGMAAELKTTKIRVQAVLPFYILTKFIGRFRPPRFLAPSPKSYVRSAMRLIGVEDRTHGTFSHAIQAMLTQLPPQWLRVKVAFRLHSLRAKIVRGSSEDQRS